MAWVRIKEGVCETRRDGRRGLSSRLFFFSGGESGSGASEMGLLYRVPAPVVLGRSYRAELKAMVRRCCERVAVGAGVKGGRGACDLDLCRVGGGDQLGVIPEAGKKPRPLLLFSQLAPATHGTTNTTRPRKDTHDDLATPTHPHKSTGAPRPTHRVLVSLTPPWRFRSASPVALIEAHAPSSPRRGQLRGEAYRRATSLPGRQGPIRAGRRCVPRAGETAKRR